MKYKNVGLSTRTFYGVKFKPGEVKDVPGYINVKSFIRVNETPEVEAEGNAEIQTNEEPTVSERTRSSRGRNTSKVEELEVEHTNEENTETEDTEEVKPLEEEKE